MLATISKMTPGNHTNKAIVVSCEIELTRESNVPAFSGINEQIFFNPFILLVYFILQESKVGKYSLLQVILW